MTRISGTRIAGSLWEGLRLTRHQLGADPHSPLRPVAIPAGWEEEAGLALAALIPGDGPVSLPRAADAWIGRAMARGQKAGLFDARGALYLAEGLRAILLARRGAPGAEVWRGQSQDARYVLNLPAFLEPDGSFDLEGYQEAVALGVRFLEALSAGKASRLRLGFADLAGLLAALGLCYASDEARAVAAGIAALSRGAADAESARIAARLGAREPVALPCPAPPDATAIPGLAVAAQFALDAAAASPGLRHQQILALGAADAAEALLGAETPGISPAAATRIAATAAGMVELPTRAALAAARLDPDRAAAMLAPACEAARRAMADAVMPMLHLAPPAPALMPRPRTQSPAARVLLAHPPAAGGCFQAVVGGHRITMRTAEDAQGRLREIAFTLSRESAAYRSLMDAFAQAVCIGLRHGVPLEAFADAFAHARFGPSGRVDGDPAIARATSMLDWAFRRLALEYLGRADLEQPSDADCAPAAPSTPAQQAPLLPLELPMLAPAERRRPPRAALH